MTDWRLPINTAIAGVLTFAVMFALCLAAAYVAQEWAPRITRRDVNDQWPKDLADGGRMDRQQRDDLLAGEPVPEAPAVLRSIRRQLRKRGGTR